MNLPISQTVQAVGKIRKYQMIRSVIVVSALPISWMAFACGAQAYMAFVILLFINFINQPISMFLLRKIFAYSYREYINRVILPCILFSIVTPVLPFVVHSVLDESFVRLMVVGTLSVVMSVIFIYLIVMTENEKVLINGFIKKIRKRH